MDKLQMWCKGFSIVTIISGIILSLIPESKLMSSFKSLVALILTVMFISPLSGLLNKDFKNTFSLKKVDESEMITIADNQLYNFAENAIENEIERTLLSENISVKCDVFIEENDEVATIENIEITGEYNDNLKEYIIEKINELFQVQMNIEFSG